MVLRPRTAGRGEDRLHGHDPLHDRQDHPIQRSLPPFHRTVDPGRQDGGATEIRLRGLQEQDGLREIPSQEKQTQNVKYKQNRFLRKHSKHDIQEYKKASMFTPKH